MDVLVHHGVAVTGHTDDPIVIGKQLGISPCPKCGEPLGARYKARDGRMLCWPCTGYKLKSPAPFMDALEGSYAWLVRRVWRRIEDRTGLPPVYLTRDRIGGYCPTRCGGIVAVQFLDNPPRMRFESLRGEDVCSTGCPAARINEALR